MALYNEAKEAKKLLSQLINQCVLENETVKSCIKARRAVVTTAANTTVANRVGVKLIGDNTELFLPYNPVFAPNELVKGMIVSVWYNYSLNNGIVMQDAKWQQGGNASGGQEFDPAGTYPELTSGKATADAAGNTITSFYAHGINFTIDNDTFILSAALTDANGNQIGQAKTIDLPLESVVVDGEFNEADDTIILTLQNGNTMDIPVGDLINGLASQTEVDNIVNGSTTVGKAANVTSQINGHAISDIFESDGVTVKEATQAQGAQYLSNEKSMNNNASIGWVNVGSITKADVTSQYSVFLLVNGAQHIQGGDKVEASGLLEFDFDGNNTASLTILFGNLNTAEYCVAITDTEVVLYHNMTATYNTAQFTVLAQKQYGATAANSRKFNFTNNTYGQSAPANAVYAVVRNNASEAEMLTDSLNIGNISSSNIQGYYQFLTASQLDNNSQQTNIRLEFTDTNMANYLESICGIELRYYNSRTSPNRVDVYVLYGDPEILNDVWVSVTADNGISLYFYNRGAYSNIRVKALYQGNRSRTDADNFNIFENTTSYIAELPADNTNTALPELEHYQLLTQAATANSLTAVQIPNNADLNDYVGSKYWGKVFYATGGQAISNSPVPASYVFHLEVLRLSGNTAQVITAGSSSNNSLAPTRYFRYVSSNLSYGNWEEIVTSDGNYPTLGAGYLAKRNVISTNGVQQGWIKIGTVPMSTVATWQDYNCIMLISGVFRGSSVANAPKTSFIEIECRKYASSLGDMRIGILCGDINSNGLCYVIEDNLDVSVYIYNNYTEAVTIVFEILSENGSSNAATTETAKYNIFQWSSDRTAIATPSGAVYAVIRNNAAQAESLSTAGTIRTNLASSSSPTYTNGGNITPGVTGILPYANGGLGSNNFSNTQGILTAPVSSGDTVHSLPRGTTGQVLTARSNNVPQWTNQSALSVGYATNAGFANEAEHADSADSAGNATNLGGRPASDYITVDDTDIEKAVIIDTDQTVTGRKIFTNELNAFYGIAFEARGGGSFTIGHSYGETSPIGTTVYGAMSITRYNTSNTGVMAQIQLDSSMEYTAQSHEFNGKVYLPSNTYLGVSQGSTVTLGDYVVNNNTLYGNLNNLRYTITTLKSRTSIGTSGTTSISSISSYDLIVINWYPSSTEFYLTQVLVRVDVSARMGSSSSHRCMTTQTEYFNYWFNSNTSFQWQSSEAAYLEIYGIQFLKYEA